MKVREAITFDDVLLEPSESSVLPSETILKTKITKDIDLNVPLASAAMDTVTESEYGYCNGSSWRYWRNSQEFRDRRSSKCSK